MARTLTEKRVLKKLDIPDFRHMTKEKIIEFASMLPNMDPEVAKKALEQFPEFKNLAIEVVKQLQTSVEAGIRSNDSSQKAFYDACNETIETLKNELLDKDLSPEQEREVRENILYILNLMYDKDTENKAFLLKTVKTIGIVAAAVVLAASSLLGNDIKGVGDLMMKHKDDL